MNFGVAFSDLHRAGLLLPDSKRQRQESNGRIIAQEAISKVGTGNIERVSVDGGTAKITGIDQGLPAGSQDAPKYARLRCVLQFGSEAAHIFSYFIIIFLSMTIVIPALLKFEFIDNLISFSLEMVIKGGQQAAAETKIYDNAKNDQNGRQNRGVPERQAQPNVHSGSSN